MAPNTVTSVTAEVLSLDLQGPGSAAVEFVVWTPRLFRAIRRKHATGPTTSAEAAGQQVIVDQLQANSKVYVRLRVCQPDQPVRKTATADVQLGVTGPQTCTWPLTLPGQEAQATVVFIVKALVPASIANTRVPLDASLTFPILAPPPTTPKKRSWLLTFSPFSSRSTRNSTDGASGNDAVSSSGQAMSTAAPTGIAATSTVSTAPDRTSEQPAARSAATVFTAHDRMYSAETNTDPAMFSTSHSLEPTSSGDFAAGTHLPGTHATGSLSGPLRKRQRVGGFLFRLFGSGKSLGSGNAVAPYNDTPAGEQDSAYNHACLSQERASPRSAYLASGIDLSRDSDSSQRNSRSRLDPLRDPFGSAYDVHDNALALSPNSDVSLRICSSLDLDLPAGLRSPGPNLDSPANGPDRLRIQPPLHGMANASLHSPVSRSPSHSHLRSDATPSTPTRFGTSSPLPRMPRNTSAMALSNHTSTIEANCIATAVPSQLQAPPPEDPLLTQLQSVMTHIEAQTEINEDLRIASISQCQFLMDCAKAEETRWLVADNLLQLKAQVAFPFHKGTPLLDARGWHQLVLPRGSGSIASTSTSAPSPASSLEVLKVRWADCDQRKVGGNHACAAIALEVTLWCLRNSRLRVPSSKGRGGPFGPVGRHLSSLSSGSSRGADKAAASAWQEGMEGSTLAECIKAGTAVWQRLLESSEDAQALASANGDFDLEHMMQLGGYGQVLQLADYTATSLVSPRPGCSSPAAVRSPGSGTWAISSPRQGSYSGMFNNLMHFGNFAQSLVAGLYIIGCHGHFCTLWIQPSGVVHLIDSLGASLAADCPLAFVVEFGSMQGFVQFFADRHKAACDGAKSEEDITAGNSAALIEVHMVTLKT